jgi:hypothetical protein
MARASQAWIPGSGNSPSKTGVSAPEWPATE